MISSNPLFFSVISWNPQVCYTFVVILQFLDILLCFFFFSSLFSPCISVLGVSVDISSRSETLFSTVTSLLMDPLKAFFFIFVIVFLIYSISFFILSLNLHLSAYIVHLFLNIFYFLRDLSIFIIVTLNPKTGNSKILAKFGSGSDTCSLLKLCFLPLVFCVISFLTIRHNILGR